MGVARCPVCYSHLVTVGAKCSALTPQLTNRKDAAHREYAVLRPADRISTFLAEERCGATYGSPADCFNIFDLCAPGEAGTEAARQHLDVEAGRQTREEAHRRQDREQCNCNRRLGHTGERLGEKAPRKRGGPRGERVPAVMDKSRSSRWPCSTRARRPS